MVLGSNPSGPTIFKLSYLPWLCLLIASLLPVSARAETAAAPIFLWQIQSPSNISYLLGSLHTLRATDHPLPSAMQQAYAASSRLLLEADLDDALGLPAIRFTFERGYYTTPDSLRPRTDPTTFTRLEAYGQANNIRRFDETRPWLLNSLIVGVELQKGGFLTKWGVERTFLDQARSDAKTISTLETIVEQLGFLADAPESTHLATLASLLQDPSAVVTQTLAIARAWLHGDLDSIGRMTQDLYESDPPSLRTLILDRNLRWLPTIEGILNETERTFIVVGAAHLAEPEGLISLLRARGYRVTQAGANELPPEQPWLQIETPSEKQPAFKFQFHTRPDLVYQLQHSRDLRAWTDALMFSGTGQFARLTNTIDPASTARFYRVLSRPAP